MSSKYYQQFKDKAIALLGDKCAHCGSTGNLEIDHIDWREKSFNVSSNWSSKKVDVWEELETKCQVLCSDCHLEKSKKDLSEQNKKDRAKCHGTVSQYTRYKCRCRACKKAHSQYKKEYRLRKGITKRTYG